MMKLLQVFSKLFKKDRVRESKKIESKHDLAKAVPKKDKLLTKKAVIAERKAQEVQLQVGLDFGASSTKIVYTLLSGRRIYKPLIFDHNLDDYYPSYCIPSLAAFNDSGELLLGTDAAHYLADKNWDSGLRRFKVLVAGKFDKEFSDADLQSQYDSYLTSKNNIKDKLTPSLISVIYLAYVMKLARNKICDLPEFSNFKLDFIFNVCMPIDHYENNKIKPEFERIFASAQKLERKWKECDQKFNLLNEAIKIGINNRYDAEDEDARVFAIPEAVAEVAAYLKSLSTQPGIHAVIDFGYGTTDISIFNLIRDKYGSTPHWYAAKNISKGTFEIEKIFLKSSTSKDSKSTNSHLRKIFETLTHEQHSDLGFAIRKKTESLWKLTHPVWRDATKHMKIASAWQGVHIFTCGGGSKNPHVNIVFGESCVNDWEYYKIEELPKPENFDDLNGKAQFERLSVAYGLSFPKPEIDRYVLPANTADHTPPSLPVREVKDPLTDIN